jgi:hypothetical protein
LLPKLTVDANTCPRAGPGTGVVEMTCFSQLPYFTASMLAEIT